MGKGNIDKNIKEFDLQNFKDYWNKYLNGETIESKTLMSLGIFASEADPIFVSQCLGKFKI